MRACFGILTLLLVGTLFGKISAADVSVEITDQGFRPDHMTLQSGEGISFTSVMESGTSHSLIVVDAAGQQIATQQIDGQAWSHRFPQAGRFELRISDLPSHRGTVVVFSAEGSNADLRHQTFSYSLGYDLGRNVVRNLENLDLPLFSAGIEDAYRGREPKLSPAEMDFIVKEYGREVARRARDAREDIAARNLSEGREFQASNALKANVVSLPSGLQYEVLKAGSGPKPSLGGRVRVHHRAWFLDGREFDSTYPEKAAEFVLSEHVLPGYSEGLRLMSEGALWRLYIPPQLAYGGPGVATPRPGSPAIEGNAMLIFEVELLAVIDSDPGDSE